MTGKTKGTLKKDETRRVRIIAKLPLLLAVLAVAMALISSPWHLVDWLYGAIFGLMVGWSIHLHDTISD